MGSLLELGSLPYDACRVVWRVFARSYSARILLSRRDSDGFFADGQATARTLVAADVLACDRSSHDLGRTGRVASKLTD